MATSKTALDLAMDKLRKSAAEDDVTPKGKKVKSNGGNPVAKQPVRNPGDEDGDADGEPEELNEGDITSAKNKGKIKNPFKNNEGFDESGAEGSTKKSMTARLRDVAERLRKGTFGQGDIADDSGMDDGSMSDQGMDDGSGMDDGADEALKAAISTIKQHPSVKKAILMAIAEAVAGDDGSDDSDMGDDQDYGDDDDYGSDDDYDDDESEPDDSEEMSMSFNYPDALAKAMASKDDTGELRKAIGAEPVVAALAEYLVEFGNELLTRNDEQMDVIKSLQDEVASLRKSMKRTQDTVAGIADVTLASAEMQKSMSGNITAIAETPRMPSPGIRLTDKPMAKSKAKASEAGINFEALQKSIEHFANQGDEKAIKAMAMLDINPNASFIAMSDEARAHYDSLAGK